MESHRQRKVSHISLCEKVSYSFNWLIFYYIAVTIELIVHIIGVIKYRLHMLLGNFDKLPIGGGKSAEITDVLKRHQTILSKVPQHLSIILSNDITGAEDLSNIIYWSMGIGVQHVSVYDPKGILDGRYSEFEDIVRSQQTLPGRVVFVDPKSSQRSDSTHEEYYSHAAQDNTEKPSDNFYQSPPEYDVCNVKDSPVCDDRQNSVQVSIIKPENGKSELAVLCQRFGEAVKSKSLKISDIDIEYIDQHIREQLINLPDPDLVIYTSDYCCTYGLLPWHIRLTEFMPINQKLSFHEFIKILYKYAKTEQRFGK